MHLVTSHKGKGSRLRLGSAVIICVIAFAVVHGTAFAAAVKQKSFTSPEKAVNALINALIHDYEHELLAIFGPEGKKIVSSGDEVADEAARKRFMQAFKEKNRLKNEDNDTVVLYVGKEDWPFPVPIVRDGDSWHYDTAAGKEEILNRRIGRNELKVMEVMKAYVNAQREYIAMDRDGDQVKEYAQKFLSTERKKDGLYWEAKEGDNESPFGPLVAAATKEGYVAKQADKPIPYYGYYYKVLKDQGDNAPGGAYDYVVNGNMIFGFALIAYPAKYGNSGIMTFMVNQQGIIYQKNLGEDTETIAGSITKYDPDKAWKRVKEQ